MNRIARTRWTDESLEDLARSVARLIGRGVMTWKEIETSLRADGWHYSSYTMAKALREHGYKYNIPDRYLRDETKYERGISSRWTAEHDEKLLKLTVKALASGVVTVDGVESLLRANGLRFHESRLRNTVKGKGQAYGLAWPLSASPILKATPPLIPPVNDQLNGKAHDPAPIRPPVPASEFAAFVELARELFPGCDVFIRLPVRETAR